MFLLSGVTAYLLKNQSLVLIQCDSCDDKSGRELKILQKDVLLP